MKARDNPFSTDRVLKARYRPRGITWEEILARLDALDRRAAIVGPEGSGKTTLLEDLGPRLRSKGFTIRELFLNQTITRAGEWTRRGNPAGFLKILSKGKRHRIPFPVDFFRALTDRDVILFDGADLLTRPAWARFLRLTRLAAGLVVTAHAPGRLPSLVHCSTTPELFEEIVGEIAPSEIRRLRGITPGLFRKHRGNLRDALRELYDLYARG